MLFFIYAIIGMQVSPIVSIDYLNVLARIVLACNSYRNMTVVSKLYLVNRSITYFPKKANIVIQVLAL